MTGEKNRYKTSDQLWKFQIKPSRLSKLLGEG